MGKTKNGCYKAVSIISLIIAIVSIVGIVAIALLLFVSPLTIEQSPFFDATGVGAEDSYCGEVAYEGFIATFISIIIYGLVNFVPTAVFHFIAYAKTKKYAELTDEEAYNIKGKLIAWIVCLFIFSGLLNGLLMLFGFINITRPQIERFEKNGCVCANNVGEEPQSVKTNVPVIVESENIKVEEVREIKTDDLDLMITRLEKLNKIKEMGGVSDEEYEKIRQEIVSKRN